MGRLTKPLDESSIKATRMTHTPIREIHLADDRMFNDSLDAYRDIVNKLGQLEDIEEELGTDFRILTKAKKNGIWRKIFDDVIIHYKSHQISVYIDHIETGSGKELYLFDYGDEWALTKEELL